MFISGMAAGSLLILVFGALAASSKIDLEDEYDDVTRKYVALLEHQVFGTSNPDLDDEDDDTEEDDE